MDYKAPTLIANHMWICHVTNILYMCIVWLETSGSCFYGAHIFQSCPWYSGLYSVIILQLYLQSDLIIQNIYKGNGIGIEGCRGENIYSILYCWQYGSTGPAPEKPQTELPQLQETPNCRCWPIYTPYNHHPFFQPLSKTLFSLRPVSFTGLFLCPFLVP